MMLTEARANSAPWTGHQYTRNLQEMSRAVLLQLPWWTAVLMIPLWSTPAPLPFLSTLLPSINPPSSHWPTSRSIWFQCCRFWRNLKPETLVLLPLPCATNLRVDILRQQGFLKMKSMDLNLQKSPMQWYRLAWAQTWRISKIRNFQSLSPL